MREVAPGGERRAGEAIERVLDMVADDDDDKDNSDGGGHGKELRWK